MAAQLGQFSQSASRNTKMNNKHENESKGVKADDGSPSVVLRLWSMYKKMTVFPAQMPISQNAGKVAYVLMSVMALYMVISITLTEKVYTDVHELSTYDHILPDVLWCPFAPGDHLRHKTSDIVNSTRDPFNRKYMVWYVREEVERLDMTDEELDALAGYMHHGHIDTDLRARLQLRVQIMMHIIQNVSKFGPNYGTISKYYENTTDPDDLFALWALLARPASYDKIEGGPYQCWPALRGTVDDTWCKAAAEPIWLNNAYCVLFPYQSLDVLMVQRLWNMKHYMFDWDQKKAMKISEGLGVKTWMGNMQMQRLVPEHMWTMYPKEQDQFSHVHYEAYKMTDYGHATPTVCQDKKNFTGNSRIDQCRERRVNSYWMFKLALWGSGYDLNPWFEATSVTHMTNKSSISSIQRVQLYGGVFGFTTGLSLLQLISLIAFASKKKLNKYLILVGEALAIVAMSVGGGYLAVINLRELMSNTRFVRTSQYQRLVDHPNPVVPHIVISQANILPMTMLNHSRLEQYNVSLMMLRYLTALSGVSVYDSSFHAIDFFEVHKDNQSLMTVKKLLYDVMVYDTDDHGSNKTEFNPRNSRNLFTDQMDEEFEILAKRLSLTKYSPPHQVYNHFRISLCVLIKFCRYKTYTVIENCCQYARYESFHYHRIADAIAIRFPTEYTMDMSGDKNGIEVYLDPDVIKEANYQYAGPQYNKLIRQFDVSRRGLHFSYVSVYLFDGKEPERRSYGYTTVHYDAMESRGKLRNTGFTINNVIRLAENEVNNCRQANADCELLGYEDAMDVMARAIAEKSMCKCHICHSVPPNHVIAELWRENACCTAMQASFCLKQPITCCPNGGKECCFHPVMNHNQTCTSQGTFVQTLLFNRRAESEAQCSPQYEIFSSDAAVSGSVVAAQISNSDKNIFSNYNATCYKGLCHRKTYTAVRTDYVSNTDKDTSKWFGLRIFIAMDEVLTSVEEDRFSSIEAAIQLFGGFGLLFGMSLMTLFEMVSACINWLYYTSRIDKPQQDTTEKEKRSIQSLCRGMIVGHVFRSVNVFLTDIKNSQPDIDHCKKASTITSKTIAFAAPVDVDYEAIHVPDCNMPVSQPEFDKQQIKSAFMNNTENLLVKSAKVNAIQDDSHTDNTQAGHVHATLSLLSLTFGISMAGYATYVLMAQISANNMDATFDVAFNGNLTPPSMALCVLNDQYKHLLNLTKQSVCKQHDSMPTACANHFNMKLKNAEETCLIKDESHRSRIHGSNLRRFQDYSIVIPTAAHAAFRQIHFWFGDISSVRKGRLSPTEPFLLGESFDVVYTLLRSIKTKDCDDSKAKANCWLCEEAERPAETILQCCLQHIKHVANMTHGSSFEPCVRNYYRITTVANPDQIGNMTVRVIDEYGVVDVVTQQDRLTWPIILSSSFLTMHSSFSELSR